LACHLQIGADPDLFPDPAYHLYADPDHDFYLMWMRIQIRMRMRIRIYSTVSKFEMVQKAEASLRDLLETRGVTSALSDARASLSWKDVYRSVLAFFKKEAEKLLTVN
jgi:hypothetical protein